MCLFRKNKWYSSQNIFILIPKIFDFIKQYNFIVTAINKALYKYKEAYIYPKIQEVKEIIFKLPTKNNEIDFDFMEFFVAELEAQRVAELEAYLQASGLNDYELTLDEKQVIEEFRSENVEFFEFEFKDIFENIKQGRRLKKDDQISGTIPFVMSGTTNNGVVGYISNPVAQFPKNSITIDIFGNTFYRDYDYGAGDDTGIYWSNNNYSKEVMLFFATAMSKAIHNKFSYGKKLRSSQSLNFKMLLPTINNKPDYEKMKTLIKSIKKLVIKDVVDYADTKIEKTKQVVNNK